MKEIEVEQSKVQHNRVELSRDSSKVKYESDKTMGVEYRNVEQSRASNTVDLRTKPRRLGNRVRWRSRVN